jgi:hypothetical protein
MLRAVDPVQDEVDDDDREADADVAGELLDRGDRSRSGCARSAGPSANVIPRVATRFMRIASAKEEIRPEVARRSIDARGPEALEGLEEEDERRNAAISQSCASANRASSLPRLEAMIGSVRRAPPPAEET